MVNFITYYSIGAENWLVPNPREMDNFIEILRKAHCTVFTGVNTLFAGLLMHRKIGEVDFSRLRSPRHYLFYSPAGAVLGAACGVARSSPPKKNVCSAGTTTSRMIGPMSMPPPTTVASGRCTRQGLRAGRRRRGRCTTRGIAGSRIDRRGAWREPSLLLRSSLRLRPLWRVAPMPATQPKREFRSRSQATFGLVIRSTSPVCPLPF